MNLINNQAAAFKQCAAGLLLFSLVSVCWSAESKAEDNPAPINFEVKRYAVGGNAPETLYCRFPTRQVIEKESLPSQEIPQEASDGKAVVRIGKDKTIFKHGSVTYELRTLTATGRNIDAVSVSSGGVNQFSANMHKDYAAWISTSGSIITIYRGSCTAFEE